MRKLTKKEQKIVEKISIMLDEAIWYKGEWQDEGDKIKENYFGGQVAILYTLLKEITE